MERSQVLRESGGLQTAGSSRDEVNESIPRTISTSKNKIRIAVTVDLDAVSGWLGTGRPSPSLISFQKTNSSNRPAFR